MLESDSAATRSMQGPAGAVEQRAPGAGVGRQARAAGRALAGGSQ